MFGGCSGFDCLAVSAELFSGVVTLLISLAVAWFTVRWRNQQQRESDTKKARAEAQRRRRFLRRLAELGTARGAGIEIRNQGGRTPLTGDELAQWLESARSAEQAVINAAKRVTEATGTLVDWFDTVDVPPYRHITTPEQLQMVINLSGVVKKAEQIILIGFSRT